MTTVAKTAEKTYSDAQEGIILEAATKAGGKINAEIAASLEDAVGKGAKSIIAKAVRMGIYQAKAKVTKSGGKVETREEVAEEICELLGKSFNGLEKAPKLALVAIRDRLAA